MCLPRTGVVACPGFDYSRNSVRELSTEEANALRALFAARRPIARLDVCQQPEVLQHGYDAAEAVSASAGRASG